MTENQKQQQKLAALGMLSAGIAHEIQNPLNFVINFSKMSEKLLSELKEIVDNDVDVDDDVKNDLNDITADLQTNMQKIQEHGERAISIIQGILLISRGKEGELLPTDIPHMVHEYVWLAYHAKRANDKTFNVTINETYPEQMPKLMVIPQDLSRAVLNVMNNACYAVKERDDAEKTKETYHPTISVCVTYSPSEGSTSGILSISICDNGTGISKEVEEKLFHENVTSKPVGQGTGLGMQIMHDIIVNGHHGQVHIDNNEGEGCTVTFTIPCNTFYS